MYSTYQRTPSLGIGSKKPTTELSLLPPLFGSLPNSGLMRTSVKVHIHGAFHMRCLRCGYCCFHYDVAIINNPTKGITGNNIVWKPSGTRCPHLRGDESGHYICAIHHLPLYKHTPCAAHIQMERSPQYYCRIGLYRLKVEKTRKEQRNGTK